MFRKLLIILFVTTLVGWLAQAAYEVLQPGVGATYSIKWADETHYSERFEFGEGLGALVTDVVLHPDTGRVSWHRYFKCANQGEVSWESGFRYEKADYFMRFQDRYVRLLAQPMGILHGPWPWDVYFYPLSKCVMY